MSSAPLRFEAVAIADSSTQPGRTARIEIVQDLARAEPVWRHLEQGDVLATPYQRYDLLAPWLREVGARTGVTPFLVVGRDDTGAPAFLWPLGRSGAGPLTVVRFLGGKHANFNLALWRRDVAAAMDAPALRAVIAAIAAAGPRVDLLQLFNQPESWEGLPNPLAALPHQASPSFGYRGRLQGDFEALLASRSSTVARRKMRSKERALANLGALRASRIATREEAERVLSDFFTQKSERLAEQGLPDVFAEPGVRDFITEAATARLAEGRPAIELYALELDSEILATFGAVTDGRRLSTMFNSMTRGPLAAKSPGQLLLQTLVRLSCERGIGVFDLGVGEASYKQLFCDEAEPLFDSFIGLTPAGHLAAAASRLAYACKRHIKHNPAIWQAITATRRLRGGRTAAED